MMEITDIKFDYVLFDSGYTCRIFRKLADAFDPDDARERPDVIGIPPEIDDPDNDESVLNMFAAEQQTNDFLCLLRGVVCAHDGLWGTGRYTFRHAIDFSPKDADLDAIFKDYNGSILVRCDNISEVQRHHETLRNLNYCCMFSIWDMKIGKIGDTTVLIVAIDAESG